MGEFSVLFNPELNITTLAGTSMVFHCHYYNCAVQKVIEEVMGEKARNIFQQAAVNAVSSQIAALMPVSETLEVKLQVGFALLKQLGFGCFELTNLSSTGGVVVSNSSHYALGWFSQYGEREHPVCDFITGYLQALFAIALAILPEQVEVKEVECMTVSETECRFIVDVLSGV